MNCLYHNFMRITQKHTKVNVILQNHFNLAFCIPPVGTHAKYDCTLCVPQVP